MYTFFFFIIIKMIIIIYLDSNEKKKRSNSRENLSNSFSRDPKAKLIYYANGMIFFKGFAEKGYSLKSKSYNNLIKISILLNS